METRPDLAAVQIFYDGACPFCTAYARLVRLKDTVGGVAIIDVRSGRPEAERLAAGELGHLVDARTGARFPAGAPGVDFDAGNAVIHDGWLYQGGDAVHHIARLSSKVGVFNRFNAWMFRHRRMTMAAYPAMRGIRNAILRLLGRSQWGDERHISRRLGAGDDAAANGPNH